MATVEPKPAPTSGVGVKTTSIETGTGKDTGATLDRDEAGEITIHEQSHGHSQTVEPGVKVEAADEQAAKVVEGKTEGEATEVKPKEDDGSKAETLAELPDFDAAKPETVEAYNKQFTKADGGLNLDAFAAQWWTSVKDGDLTKGTLTDGTYQYLESQYGLSKDEVKEIEAGQIAQRQAEAGSLAARAGGAQPYQAALAWGREGGYTPEQIASFNAAINGKNRNTANDAVDLLMARFDKATRSTARPKKTTGGAASAGATTPSGDVFHSVQEWKDARAAAGRDMVKQQAVSNKFRRSKL